MAKRFSSQKDSKINKSEKTINKIKVLKNKSKVLFIIRLILIILIVYSVANIINWRKENEKTYKVMEEISNSVLIDENKTNDEKEKYNVNFSNLKGQNPDVKAWFKVNETNIEYPLVQSKDNSYYLTHSFDNSYNTAGWVFADFKNKFDGTDNNMVIYAHNRRDGSLFGTLKNILTEEWQNNEENFIIPFITENEKAEYQVFSVYRIENEDYYIKTDFNGNEFSDFIDIISKRSKFNFNENVASNDNILTLSTCANDNKYRVVLHAKEIK